MAAFANVAGSRIVEKLIIIIAGKQISGFADAEFLTIDYDNDRITSNVGTSGEVAAVVNNKKLGTATLRLQETSADNDVLSAIYELTLSGGFQDFALDDASGRTIAGATKCWIPKLPSLVESNEVQVREWVIKLADLEMFMAYSVRFNADTFENKFLTSTVSNTRTIELIEVI